MVRWLGHTGPGYALNTMVVIFDTPHAMLQGLCRVCDSCSIDYIYDCVIHFMCLYIYIYIYIYNYIGLYGNCNIDKYIRIYLCVVV